MNFKKRHNPEITPEDRKAWGVEEPVSDRNNDSRSAENAFDKEFQDLFGPEPKPAEETFFKEAVKVQPKKPRSDFFPKIKISSKKDKKETSSLDLFLGLASLGAGAVHGYYDAQGLSFADPNMEYTLTWGPAKILGIFGATKGGFLGACEAGSKLGPEGIILGGTLGSVFGGAGGFIKGGIQTLLGYGLGYFAGYLTR